MKTAKKICVKQPLSHIIIFSIIAMFGFAYGLIILIHCLSEIKLLSPATISLCFISAFISFLIGFAILNCFFGWALTIEGNTIEVKTALKKRRYTYSQLSKVYLISTYLSYRQKALELIFADGRRCVVTANYRNYDKLISEISKHKSIMSK